MNAAPVPAFPTRIAYAQAQTILAAAAARARLEAETVATPRAHGRVLARDLVAPIALPSFDNSAMDGFALRHADLAASGGRLRLAGEQFAGADAGYALGSGECLRITTGAPLPAGADTVAIKENARIDGDEVIVPVDTRAGHHVRHAGEDVRAGDAVLTAGMVLTPARLSLAMALGVAQLAVARQPTVAVFTTGDELVEPGLPLQRGQIYNSNRELLLGLLRVEGIEATAWPTLPDDRGRVAAMLHDAAASFDLVLTCGAVSAGEKDHIPAVLQAAAAAGEGAVHFWKVMMKPGMPVLSATLGRARLLCLPGNPVSVLATWLTFGRTLLDGLQGRAEPRPAWHARLSAPFAKRHERREFLRGRLLPGEDAVLRVEPNPADGSHRLAAAAHADCLIVLPEGARDFAAGDRVEVLPMPSAR